MATPPTPFRTAVLILLACAVTCVHGTAQPPAAAPTSSYPKTVSADPPLPDIAALMHDVETNQRRSEAIEKDYIYHSVETAAERDSSGRIKKITVTEYDHLWLNGVPVRRMVKKDGKPLSADEAAKENERVDKLAARSSEKRDKADAEGKQTDPHGNQEVTVSRLLELGSFSNARRVEISGRDTIAVDFTGDPKAKTRNRAEEVIRDLAGTVWIDQRDHVLVRVEGHFVNSFKIAGGLFANVQKGTRFSMAQTKVNDEVWLPAHLEGEGSFHALLFFGFNGSGEIVNSDYRKFRTTSKILPGTTPVKSSSSPED